MRVVLLTAGVRGIGSYCINLYHMLRTQGHEVLLISERPWEKEPLDSFYQAPSFMLFGMAPVVYRPAEVVKAIVAFKPDLIHHHWPCGTMDLLFGMIARHHIPYVVTLHVSIASKQQILDRFWYFLFSRFRKWLPGAAAVNCISDFVRDQLQERIPLPPEQVYRVYAGINEQIFHPGAIAEPSSSERPIELLFVGQIMPEKGIDMLVRAVLEISHRRSEFRLTIVGQGPLERRLKRISRGSRAIRWAGFLSGQRAVAAYYAASDVTVLPTRWDEAFSLVPIESFGCGTPVIATARGGTPEQITDGETGYLLREGSYTELVKTLKSLDLDTLRAMRTACRELVLRRHTLETMAAGHEELYRHVLERRSDR
jgi:glycosyltransferase involved in cell wall biosynthesis